MDFRRKLTVSLLFLLLGLPLVAQNVQVNSADPPSAPQATVNLNVTIQGRGFRRGAVARFFVTGSINPGNPGGVRVNSTTFVGGSTLVANVDIADNATISLFDIEVENDDGRTGKGIELFSVTTSGSGQPSEAPARSNFRADSTVRVRSDGNLLDPSCGDNDYADVTDPNPLCNGHRMYSSVGRTGELRGRYFLRTEFPLDPNPTRWLVLDFSQRVGTSSCPGLDTILKAYPGRYATAFSPENPDPCIDLVEIALFTEDAFPPGTLTTAVKIRIDGPDLVGHGRQQRNQWNGKYWLRFTRPLSIARYLDTNKITLTTVDTHEATLWKITQSGDQFMGTYAMPFQVTITIQ